MEYSTHHTTKSRAITFLALLFFPHLPPDGSFLLDSYLHSAYNMSGPQVLGIKQWLAECSGVCEGSKVLASGGFCR